VPRVKNPSSLYAKALDAPGLQGDQDKIVAGPFDELRAQVNLLGGAPDNQLIQIRLGDARAALDIIDESNGRKRYAIYGTQRR